MAFDQAGHLYEQFFVSKRKIEIVVSAGVESFDTGLVCFANAANQEDGNGRRARVLFETTTQFETTDSRHHDIAHHHIRRKRMGQCGSFHSVGCRGNVVAFEFEQIDQKFKNSLVVIDNQDSASI